MIRDVILDAPVFWSADLSYIWVGVVTSILAFYGRRPFTARRIYSIMLYLDGFEVVMFGIQGARAVNTRKALIAIRCKTGRMSPAETT